MTMEEMKWLKTLGLIYRAKMLITGEELVVKGIQKKNIHFVLLSEDASDNTKKKIINKCNFYEIPYAVIGSRELLGNAIGKAERVVIGIADKGFAKKIQTQIQ